MEKRKRIYVCLTIPAIILMLVFIAAPLMNAIRISFFKWNGYSQNMKWYGINNFVSALSDKLFWRSLGNTLIYGFGSTLLQNVGGLLAALFLNKKFKGRNGVRVILYMPIMISAFIMGQILYFFVQYEGGVFNELLGLIGLPPGLLDENRYVFYNYDNAGKFVAVYGIVYDYIPGRITEYSIHYDCCCNEPDWRV